MGRFSHLLSSGPRPTSTPGDRLRQALEMHQMGIELYKVQLVKAHADLDDTARHHLLLSWLHQAEPLPPELSRSSWEDFQAQRKRAT